MKNMIANPVKKAASLIICRQSKRLNSLFDYQVLMFKRKESHKFYGSVLAFPGGKLDQQKDQEIASALGLKQVMMATALRECFEESGLFITQQPVIQTEKIQQLSQTKLQYIASEFYKNSYNNSQIQFNSQSSIKKESWLYNYYRKIVHVCPPTKNLIPFIRLITVPLLKIRFDAYFYVHKIQEFKLINFMKYAQNEKYLHSHDEIVINEQFMSFRWFTPIQVLSRFTRKQIKLAPPQFIMLNIMTNFHKFKDFQQFIGRCSHNQINMGPNIVSMINNKGSMKEQFPYAATLIGDSQFPYQHCIKTQKNQYLIKLGQTQQMNKNRLLFKKPLQFFEDQYSSQCTIESSVMSKFLDSKRLLKQIELYQ